MKIKVSPSLAVVTAGLCVLVAGCSKKTAEAPAPSPDATATPVAVQQPATTPAPTALATPDTHLAESQAALKAKNYDDAATALIAAQRGRLNEQQAAAAAAQMRQLQSSIAEAAAAGDPRAQAAAARLRQAAMAR